MMHGQKNIKLTIHCLAKSEVLTAVLPRAQAWREVTTLCGS